MQHATNTPSVTVAEAVAHLGRGTVYQQQATVRPAMNALIEHHLKTAKKAGFEAKDDLLGEVKGLPGSSLKKGGAFASISRPSTWDEAEAIKQRLDAVGASSSGGGRMHGVPWGK